MKTLSAFDLCIMIPCHNEAENLPSLIEQIIRLPLNSCQVLIIDDNSTDETGEIADKLVIKYPAVSVIHRQPPKGRGLAGKDGWLWCLNKQPKYIMEMDADHSHDPQYIPQFLRVIKNTQADVVIGSRYTSGGREVRGLVRKAVSYAAERYLKWVYGLPLLTDPSSGFRLFTLEAVAKFNPQTLESPDHRITTEILFRIRKLKIVEVPIVFHDRKYGRTKLTWLVILKSLYSPLKWRIKYRHS
jgi:dolichol-phosphate mannosyltransferase